MILLVVAGGISGLLIKNRRDGRIAAERERVALAAKQKHDREVAAQIAQEKAEKAAAERKAARQRLQRMIRHSVVRSLQASITKDAKERVDQGFLDGPILRTVCEPVGGGNIDDLSDRTGAWSCLAVTEDNADGTSSGYGFSATTNYDTGAYTWHLGN